MRNLNFLRKSERKSVGTTLALTVGSPSAHRRYSALKHLTFMLLFLLGSLNVWGDEQTGTFTMKNSGQTSPVSNNGVTFTWSSSQIITGTNNGSGFKDKSQSGDADMVVTIPAGATLTGISKTNGNSWGGSASVKVYTGSSTSGTLIATIVSGTNSYTISSHNTGTTYYLINNTGANAWINSLSITYTTGGSPDPTVSVTPASWDFGTVHASDAASKVFSVSGSNLTAGDLTLTVPEGFSVSPSSIAVDGTLTATDVTVSKNTSDVDDYAGNLSINGGGLESPKTVALTMTVDADPAPTGTFELFSGDIEEGDYVIYYGGKAMNTTVSSNRLQYAEVTPSEDKIVNPDEAIIWHIAASGDYWTLYNAAVEKYAGGTTTKNQGAMLASITDFAKWSISGSSTYEFENYGRSQAASDSDKKYLRNNGTYGFACYSSSTGGALTLYKKQVAGQPKAPTFSVAGGNYESAQSVELSCETEGAKIYYTLDGSKPSSTSTEYSTAIPVSATTTIKAVAIKDEIESTVATATYTIVVWQTVADVWDDITSSGPTNAHIYGYVSQTNVGGYANNFYISDNGSTEGNQLYAYRMDMNSYSVEVGDKVKLVGDLTLYNDVKEFKYTSADNCGKVIALEAKGDLQSVAVSGTPTKTEYAANEDFDPAGLVVTGTYANGYVGVITEGITWGNDLTDNKVTETTTVHVTATVSGITNSPAHNVGVTVAAKTLLSIAVGTASYTIYTGEVLPKPVVTATFSEGDPEVVSAYAVYDSESVFNTATIDDPDPQTITVSYTFGGETKTATYTVSVKDYANADDAPYSVTEALHIITAAIGNVESAREIVVTGTVSAEKVSNYQNRYKISDGANELLVYNGKGFNDEAFTDANYPKVNDVVIVKGKVINYSNNTPEFVSAKSYLLSQIRPATLAIEDVASLEVGADDLAEGDLDITTPSDGDITFVSGDDTKATIVANAIHAVAPGTVTITANLAATENDDALNYAAASTTFSVTVVAPATKYAITFDGNGNTGGSAPEAIENKAAGAEVTLPANSYTKTGHTFTGWKVYDENEDEVTVTANAFEMPASPVTIKAQWAEIPVWAYTYTSNLELKGNSGTKSYAEKVKITVNEVLTEFDALRACTGSAAGSCTIKVPAGTQTLHFHAAAWNAKTSTITVTMGETELMEQDLTADAGIKSSSPYTLEGIPYEYYYSIDLSSYSLTEETTITFSAGSDKRFVLFGVNQEGGVVPVLDHIEIAGDLTTKSGYKAGDAIDMDGLTVNAIYTLGGTPQTPVDITDETDLEWSYDPLVEGQENVTITATYKGQTDDIEITLDEPVASADPVIYVQPSLTVNFGTVAKDASVGSKQITVTLQNVAAATATLGGTNPEAFNIDDTEIADGDVITISVVSTATLGSYSATITITDNAGLASQKVVNLSLSVEAVETPVSTSSQWVAATAADLVDGAEVLITGVKSEITYAMSEQANNNRTTAAGTLAEGVFTPGDNTMSFTLVEQASGKFALLTSNGKYLYAASSSSNQLKTRDDLGDDGKAVWSISIDGENKASIVANCETTNWRNTMRFNLNNPNPPVFACYASATQNDVILYVPKVVEPVYETVRENLAADHYYTLCFNKTMKAVQGATFWSLASKDANMAYLVEEQAPYEAGKPYIIYAETAGDLTAVLEGDATDAAGTNGALHGTFVNMDQTALNAAGDNIYILSNNALYRVDGQTNNSLKAGRAYIDLDELSSGTLQPAPGRRVRAIPMGQQTATGIENGELINGENGVQKVLINGELFILRGEKMYNANGQIVK